MRAGIVVNVTRADRRRLEAIIADRSAPQKHVWRATIILATAEGCGTAEIMRRSGKSKPVVWRWQARFMAEGVEGLTRDKTRKPGKKPLPAATVQNVVDLALGPPPGDATHWTGRMLAKAAGVSLRSVQRILEAHQLAPHRISMFKLSSDPKFAEKLKDVVGLYVDPPAHAVVLSVDEKSQSPIHQPQGNIAAIVAPGDDGGTMKPKHTLDEYGLPSRSKVEKRLFVVPKTVASFEGSQILL
jgi:transposase